MTDLKRTYVPAKKLNGEWPLIDSDPYVLRLNGPSVADKHRHIRRVFKYARRSDYIEGAALFAAGPALLLAWEKFAPSYVGRGGFAPIMRLCGAVSLTAGFLMCYQSSAVRLYGGKENAREVEMDMREMVDKVKKGEPLYGTSTLSPYMQGVASRNSRYSAVFVHVIPWFNFVNHEQHGVDTAKYYQQAERELEAERTTSA